MRRKTRIVATIGPASESPEVIEQMLEAGVNVARLNFSHSTQANHAKVFKRLRQVSDKLGRHIGILQDLCGPKIRLGEMKPETYFEVGQTVEFTHDEVVGDARRAQISYEGLHNEVKKGDRILLDDGNLELHVETVRNESVFARVVAGGLVKSRKGVNLPGVDLSVPALTEKDEGDLRFGLTLGVDMVALSFVRKARDLDRVRQIMVEEGRQVPLIAKIEKGEALWQLQAIVEKADAVMIARGDLGVEVPLEQVPLIQKDLIDLCLEKARPVITATQMLESMMESPRPTRAEVNDVANAILDGTDAVMLSGETAAGKYPVKAVEIMASIAHTTEKNLDWESIYHKKAPRGQSVGAVALAACEIAEEVQARAILACSKSGRTVQAISRFRPRAPILGITSNPETARQFSVSWGVTPALVRGYHDTDELIERALEEAEKQGVSTGERVVIAAGVPLGNPTNMVTVRTL